LKKYAYYFDLWTARTADGLSLLEQALKKSDQASGTGQPSQRCAPFAVSIVSPKVESGLPNRGEVTLS
jgi:hypothetical protein